MSNASIKRRIAEQARHRALHHNTATTYERVITSSVSGVGIAPSKKLITKSVAWSDPKTGERKFGKIECRGATTTVQARQRSRREIVTVTELSSGIGERPRYDWKCGY